MKLSSAYQLPVSLACKLHFSQIHSVYMLAKDNFTILAPQQGHYPAIYD